MYWHDTSVMPEADCVLCRLCIDYFGKETRSQSDALYPNSFFLFGVKCQPDGTPHFAESGRKSSTSMASSFSYQRVNCMPMIHEIDLHIYKTS